MKLAVLDRRLTVRHNIKTPIRIRRWKLGIPEERGESGNLSGEGILSATNSVMPVGTVLEILLKVPEIITGEPTTECLCSGHVVRVEPIDSPRGKLGVGVQFDCYQVTRGFAAQSIEAVCRGMRSEGLSRWPCWTSGRGELRTKRLHNVELRGAGGPANGRKWNVTWKNGV